MRKRYRRSTRAILTLFFAAIAGCGTPKAAESKDTGLTTPEVLSRLLAAVDAKPDEMASKKLQFAVRRDIVLPKALRGLLRRNETAYANLKYGFETREERLGWFWRSSVNSLRLVGNHIELRESLIAHMKQNGFEQFDSPDKRYGLAFRKKHERALESALFVGCYPVTGGKVEAVETAFVWRVETTEKLPLPSYDQVTKVMPSVRPPSHCVQPPKAVHALLPDLATDHVSMSGSNSTLYSLRLRVSDRSIDASDREALSKSIVERLRSEGFKQFHRSQKGSARTNNSQEFDVRLDRRNPI